MPSADKALLKAAALDALVTELQEALGNAEKNAVGITASRDTMERLFARVHGYRARIDRALEDGTVPEAAREPMLAVFRDLVAIVQDSHRALVQAASEQVPFAAGLRKAASMARARAAAEHATAQRAVELAAEDEAERATGTPAPVPLAASISHAEPDGAVEVALPQPDALQGQPGAETSEPQQTPRKRRRGRAADA